MRPLRLAAFGLFAALLVAGLALAGCGDASAVESGPLSVQTTEALDVLPAGVPLVGMVDLAAARQSGATAALLDGPMGPFGDHAAFDDFVRRTGFDPSVDLDRVYLAASPDREAGALVVLARFDRDRIERALAENAEGELVRSEIDGVPVWSAADGEGGALALPNERMMLAGTAPEVRAMIGRLARGTQGLSSDAALVALIQKARHREHAWFVTRGLDAGAPTVMGPVGEFAESTVASLAFRDAGLDLDVYLAPRAGAAAGDVADVTRGALAAARAQAGDTPQMLAMLDGAEVREDGAGVRVTMAVPQSVLDQSARHGAGR